MTEAIAADAFIAAPPCHGGLYLCRWQTGNKPYLQTTSGTIKKVSYSLISSSAVLGKFQHISEIAVLSKKLLLRGLGKSV